MKKVLQLKNAEIISKMSLKDKVSLCSGATFWDTEDMPEYGINRITVSDGPHGLRKQDQASDHLGINESLPSTCFPTASLTASSWDQELLFKMGEAIADEALELGSDVVLGPGVNIKRNPLCGRNFEYFSEDPYLAGKMGAAWIKGVQSKGIGTSVKHFAANNQENERLLSNSILDERTLREIYLRPFEIVVKEANPKTIMTAYNQINGTYMSDNEYILRHILRDEWGFDGLIMTDWGGLNDRIQAFKAGLQLEMPASGKLFDSMVIEAVTNGELDESYIDESVDRMLTLIREQVENRKESHIFDREAHHQLARKIAAESGVLLKNEDHTLPLNKETQVALIGTMAKEVRYQGAGSSHINPTQLSSIVDGFNLEDISFNYYPGYEANGDENLEYLEAAITGAKMSDVAVIVIGLPSIYESEGYDRTSLNIPMSHVNLVKEVSKVNENVVVVLLGGAPISIDFDDSTKAILNMYLGGQAVGEACTDLLFGNVNPSGKLAETYVLKYEDVPSAHSYGICPRQVEYSEGIYVGYRYYEKANQPVKYPFGFGLSYTSFEYGNLKILNNNENFTVTCDIKNTGEVDGAEIVQLYVGDKTNTIYRPIKELKGYQKVFLKVGEEKQVTFELSKKSFAYYDANQSKWNVPAGQYEILIGASSQQILLSEIIEVESEDTISNVEVPTWYIKPSGYPSKTDLEHLIGRKITPYVAPKCGDFTMRNCTLNEMHDTKAKEMIDGIIQGMVAQFGGDENEQECKFLLEITLNTPIQRLAQQTAGMLPLEMLLQIVSIANMK